MLNFRKVSFMLLVSLVILGAVTSQGLPGVITVNHWEDLNGSGWGYYYDPVHIDGSTGTPDPSNALRFDYPQGFGDGNAPSIVEHIFGSQTQELWVQYYFKYSSNWTRHPVNDKQAYFGIGPGVNQGNFFVAVGKWGNPHMLMENQIGWGPGTQTFYPNTGTNPAIETGKWYKLTIHAVQNTPGQANGIIQIWVDDRLVIDYDTVPYRSSSQGGMGFGCMQYTPVWGGTGGHTKPQNESFWVDYTAVSTEPIGSGAPPPPVVVTKSPRPPTGVKVIQ